MDYERPEIVTVADAQEATVGGTGAVAENPREPVRGDFNPRRFQAEYPGELLDVEYERPEVVTVADAQAATVGGTGVVTEGPGQQAYYDASKRQLEYPGEQLDV